MTDSIVRPSPVRHEADAGQPVRCFALVPCAGVGARAGAGGPKQYVQLAGRSLVAHTLRALQAVAAIERTMVVLSPDDRCFEQAVVEADRARLWIEYCGGATRAASVAAGLSALAARGAGDRDWVLVHDAARCLLRPGWVQSLIDACLDDEVGGLLALPLADTLKQAGDRRNGDPAGDRVAATVPRDGKWAAQTPQMFRLGLLRRALAEAGDRVTDESSAVEAMGLSPRLVVGPLENFKLTFPGDFALAERLLASRESSLDGPASLSKAGNAMESEP